MSQAALLLDLFLHCLTLSLLAIGGAVATIPELHRHAVSTRHWLSDTDFTGAVALAQAAPGPNLLFVAVVGFKVAGLTGALVAMAGMLLPSTGLTLLVTRWGLRRRESIGVRAFVSGMAPITLGLVLSTGWLLAKPVMAQPVALVLVLSSVALAWRTRINPLWLIGAGAVAGAFGWV